MIGSCILSHIFDWIWIGKSPDNGGITDDPDNHKLYGMRAVILWHLNMIIRQMLSIGLHDEEKV